MFFYLPQFIVVSNYFIEVHFMPSLRMIRCSTFQKLRVDACLILTSLATERTGDQVEEPCKLLGATFAGFFDCSAKPPIRSE